MSIQPKDELEDFYKSKDPWGYEENPHDKNRKDILTSELSKMEKPRRVLDIGCGHGFITRDLPGDKIIGVDLSDKAIAQANKISANKNTTYKAADMFDLNRKMLDTPEGFDLVLITGVLYPQYIGSSKTVMYAIIDELLQPAGFAVSVHINEWYTSRLPYMLIKTLTYNYREYQHILEIYKKP